MQRLVFTVICLILWLNMSAIASDWKIDPTKSSITYSIEAFGARVAGQLGPVDANISFDPENLQDSRILARVITTGISIDNQQYANAMRGREGLDLEVFGDARFVSETISKTPSGYSATGALALKDISHAAEINFTVEIDNDVAVADGTLTIPRSRFQIGSSSWTSVAEHVNVVIHIEAQRLQ